MTEQDNSHSLIPRPDVSLANTAAGPKRVMSAMVGDALAIGREEAVAQTARFRIGDYIWCEPDYRQILLWADALKIEPLTVIEHLLDDGTFWGIRGPAYSPENALTRFKDGRIDALHWDRRLLPLSEFRWVEGLQITSLTFSTESQPEWKAPAFSLPLPHLKFLSCRGLGLATLDLSHVPNLTELSCGENRITELNLSQVPNLNALHCDSNGLTELDLSHVSSLTELECWDNSLTELDLSHVPNLTVLSCTSNNLTELDLSHVPKLTDLSYTGNRITELDLSHVPSLTELSCGDNSLTELNLSRVPNLTWLHCGQNQLTELDLSHVPNLTYLYCSENHVTELDIRPLLSLETLAYDKRSTRLIQRPDQNF